MTDEPVGIGSRVGEYEITGHIGAGGMGDVFRARDARLGRDVAIKILPPLHAGDPERQHRFEKEARFLAALNHPNIGAIYGCIGIGAVNALVLELVEGPTLSEKLAVGRLSIAESMAIARQIAAALDAAHERGIVHRDLKPANIKIAPGDIVKVLDFGIAKTIASPDGEVATRTSDGTRAGTVIGTVGYMSPEQARGLEIDKRTDIWAFGCIVLEMLTGKPAFTAATNSDTIVAILQRDPDWSRLPADTPLLVKRMLHRCLQKEVRQRQRDIADAAADLDDVQTTPTRRPDASSPWPGWIAAAIAGAGITAALLLGRGRAPAPSAPPKATLEQLTFDASVSMMPALSPDGKLLAYASDRAGHGDLDLWVQQTAGGEPIRLTDDPADDLQPTFSPDGSQVVFRSERGGGGVYVVPALGGAARRLADGGRSPRFSPDGRRIAYWTGPWRGNGANAPGSVFTLDLSGGEPTRIFPDFNGAREPLWSPDGKSLLARARETRDSPVDLYLARIDSGAASRTGVFDRNGFRDDVTRLSISTTILGAWTQQGVLMSAASGLWMLPISPDSGTLTGEPQQVTVGGGRHIYGTADNQGAIVLTVAEAPRAIERAPLNNDGPAELLYTDGRTGGSRPSQTPDGSRILYDRPGVGFREIWIKPQGMPDRLVLRAPERAANMVISPDGTHVAYTVGPDGGAGEGYMINVEGGVPARLCVDCIVWGFLSNSTSILITDQDSTRLRAIDTQSGSARIILEAPSVVSRPHISPDDRRIAFNVGREQWIAAAYPDRPTPQTEWQRVDQDTDTARACGWSADSQTAYLLLDTDGFRCLWGQRVDPRTGALLGGPFAVRHFHKTVTQEFSTSFGNAITATGFLYGGGNLKANLWRLTLAAR